jgi:competence protein ComEA
VFDAPAGPAATSSSSTADAEAQPARLNLATLAATPTALGLGAAVIVALLATFVALGGLPSGAADAAAPSGSVPVDGAVGGELVIEVAGAVAKPGVYHLEAGSRVGDAIAAAGGFVPRVAADRVAADLNLAAPLHDGDRILVPSRDDRASPAPGGGGTGARVSPGAVDLNHATEAELDALPGIGPVTAAKIVASREETPFTSVDELRSRGLVGQKVFDKLRPLITVG